MKATIARDEDWATIEAALPPNWRALAETHAIIKTTGRGSTGKVKDPAIVLRTILHHVCSGAALETTVALAAALFVVDVSAPALHKWMVKSGGWLADLVAAMLATGPRFAPTRWAGLEVIAVDATTAQRPGATTTTARVHYALRLADLRAIAVAITDARVGETLRNFAMAAGQLWIADRGYANANSIAHAVAQHADVLIRYAFGALPLFSATGAALDVRACVARLGRPGRVRAWSAWVHPKGGARIAVRLIAMRLSEAQAAQARARVRREHKAHEVTAEMLDLAQYVVLVTTVTNDVLTAAELIELYRLRWAIELEFKRDKSIGGLDGLPNRKPATIQTWLCAKMLGLLLARRLAEPGEPFPPSVVGAYALRPRLAHLRAAATADHA